MPSDIDNAPLSAPSRSLSVEDAKKEKDDSALVPQLLTIDDPAVAASDDGRKKPVMELRRDLTSRQISMISIAGTIGTGLFLGTGSALATGGPASMVLSYSIVGALIFLLMHCITEFVTQFPVAGGWPTYLHRFADEPTSFAVGWAAVLSHSITIAGDCTSVQLIMGWWTTHLTWLASLSFLAFITATNLFGVKYYGELEYLLSLLKIAAIVVFFFLGIAVNAGANVDHAYIGAQYWTHGEAPFVGGFGGFVSLFVKAAYAYSGTEVCGISAAETKNPTRNIRRIANRVFFRILGFYITTVILIAFNIPYDYPKLSTSSASTSPFTIVFSRVGARSGASFMNVVVLTSILSAASEACYTGSRILYGMALRGHAPKIFGRLSSRAVPDVALGAHIVIGLIFFGLSFAPGGASQIWVWVQKLVGINSLFTWAFIGLASWRMRAAWIAQGKPVTALKAPNIAGSWGAPFVVFAFCFLILIQGWQSFTHGFQPVKFVQSYLEIPFLFILYWSFRLIKGSKTPSLLEIDLVTGEYMDTQADIDDNENIYRREKGRYGFLWVMWGWVA